MTAPKRRFAVGDAVTVNQPGRTKPILGRISGAPDANGFYPVTYALPDGRGAVWLAHAKNVERR